MNGYWQSVTDFMYLSLFIFIAVLLKQKIKFFNKYLIPTSIVAGLLGMVLGPNMLNWVPFNTGNLEKLVYHLMAIGFIAITLKDRNHKTSKDSVLTGLSIVATYIVQGLVGFALSLVLLYTAYPDLFPTFGLLLPLGYGQGPGQAYSIGKQWESLGFKNGGQFGLTMATLGYLWACFGGVVLLNYLIRKKNIKPEALHNTTAQNNIVEESEPGEMPLSTGLDKITTQFFLIGIVYLVSYLTIVLLEKLLTPLGTFGQTMSQLLWGFHFLVGTVYAMLLRLVYDYLKKKKIVVQNYPNNYLLQRISGGCFDYMVTAALAALSLYAIRDFLLPLAIISTIGGFVSVWFIVVLCRKFFKVSLLEYIVALYGMLTGTLSTGLALLREVDPNFNTEVAENLVLGSAVGLVFGLPLMVLLNFPVLGYINKDPMMYIYTLVAFVIYLIAILLMMVKVRGRDKVKASTSIKG